MNINQDIEIAKFLLTLGFGVEEIITVLTKLDGGATFARALHDGFYLKMRIKDQLENEGITNGP